MGSRWAATGVAFVSLMATPALAQILILAPNTPADANILEGTAGSWTVTRSTSNGVAIINPITTSNAGVAQPTPPAVIIQDGQFSATFTVNGVDGPGTATISSTAPGFAPIIGANINVNNRPPEVIDPGIPASGFTGQNIQFSPNVNDVPADTLTYSWTFGDGNTSNLQNPTHTYANAGTYTVTLTVNDGDGGTDFAQAQILITSGGRKLTVNVLPQLFEGLQGVGCGTYTLNPLPNASGEYPEGATVTITAVPQPCAGGFDSFFFEWGGDVPEGEPPPSAFNPIVITMDEDKTITLLFSREYFTYDNVGDLDHDRLPDIWEVQYGLDPKDDAGNNGRFGNPDNDFIPSRTLAWPLTGARLLQGYCSTITPFVNELEARGWDASSATPEFDPGNVPPNGAGTSDDPLTDPNNPDTDADGMFDGWEYYFWYWRGEGAPTHGGTAIPQVGLNPHEGNDSQSDTDGDTLLDGDEFLVSCTDPTHADTDRDGMDDYWEQLYIPALNPLNPNDATANSDGEHMAANTIVINLFGTSITNDLFHNEVYQRSAPTMDAGDTYFDPRTSWRGGTPDHPDTIAYIAREEYLGCDHVARIIWDANGINVGGIIASFDDTDPTNPDTDSDTMPDGWECYVGADPKTDVDAGNNVDDDSLSNSTEWSGGQVPTYVSLSTNVVAGGNSWTNKQWPTDPGNVARVFAWRNVWFDSNTNGMYDVADTQVWGGGHALGFVVPPGTLGLDTPVIPAVDKGGAAEGVFYDSAGTPDSGAGVWLDHPGGDAGIYDDGIDLVLAGAPAPLATGSQDGLLWYHNDPHPRDTDWDGLPDGNIPGTAESESSLNANPTSSDTDGDFLPDGWEVFGGTQLLVRDADSDQRADDTIDVDIDNDGLENHLEYWTGTVFEWMHIDSTWPDFMVPDRVPRMLSRPVMRWDQRGTGFGSLLATAAPALPAIMPPDFITCPSFNVTVGQAASTSLPYNHYHTTRANAPDTDDDGMDDYWETYHALNPTKGVRDQFAPPNPVGIRAVGSGDATGDWDADPLTVGRFEHGILALGVVYTNLETAMVDLAAGLAAVQAGPFNFGLELMDPDADGIVNYDEYSHEALPEGRPLHHTDPTSYNRTDPYGNDFGDGVLRSFVTENYQSDNGFFSPWDWSGHTAFPFAVEATEGFDTDNDLRGDMEEIARLTTLPNGVPLTGNSDPVDSRDPVRNRAIELNRSSGDFLRTMGAWQTVAPRNFFTRFTVQAWVYPRMPNLGTNEPQTVVERGASYPSQWGDIARVNFRLGIDSRTGVPFAMYNGKGAFEETVVAASPARALSTNEWAHLSAVYDGRRLILYINGVFANAVASELIPANGVGDGAGGYFFYPGTTIIGASEPDVMGPTDGIGVFSLASAQLPVGATNFFDGFIDEVQLWNGSRSQSAIVGTMRKKLPRTQQETGTQEQPYLTSLAHYFAFDDCPDVDVNWVGGTNDLAVPAGLDYLQGPTLQMHQTISIWSNTPQRSAVYTGSVTNPYNFLIFAEDLTSHAPVMPPEDDWLHPNRTTNDTFAGTLPAGYRNSSNPYYNGLIGAGNVWDMLFMNGAQADGDVFTESSWMDPNGNALANPDGQDQDGDGLPDNWETENGLDPNDPTGDDGADGDPDGDGLNNLYEYLTRGNPLGTDTDGNGISDGQDDFDGDGLINIDEQNRATMPHLADTDDDGLTDGEEATATDNFNGITTTNVPNRVSNPLSSLDPPVLRSMLFDGASKLVIPPQNKFMSDEWTIELWVKPTAAPAAGTDAVLVSRHVRDTLTGETVVNYEMGVTGTGNPQEVLPYVRYHSKLTNGAPVEVRLNLVNGVQVGCTNGLPLDVWTHLTSTYSPSNTVMRLYVNGELAAFRTDVSLRPITTYGFGAERRGDEVTVGAARSTPGDFTGAFTGYIDEFKFVGVALTAEEVSRTFNAPTVFGAAPPAYTIPFKTGWEEPAAGVDPGLLLLPGTQQVHAVVQFYASDSTKHKLALQAAGLELTHTMTPWSYTVRGPANRIAGLAGARWRGTIAAEKKIAGSLGGYPVGASRWVLVQFFPNTSESLARADVLKAGGEIWKDGFVDHNFMLVRLSEGELESLAKADSVSWITPSAQHMFADNARAYSCGYQSLGSPAPFTINGVGWDGPGLGAASLTYHMAEDLPNLTNEKELSEAALAKWAEVGALRFEETATLGAEESFDIFFSAYPPFPFDGVFGVLAYAFYPNDINPEPVAGNAHFDPDEPWSATADAAATTIDYRQVSLHEFGHSLGIAHSENPLAIMAPFYQPGMEPVELTDDDRNALLALYGPQLGALSAFDADFRFDDSGATAEDFTEQQDWLENFQHAGVLEGSPKFVEDSPVLEADSDSDGLPDWWEIAYGLDPVSAEDSGVDTDGDGLLNLSEYRAGTQPLQVDSDVDGLADYLEDSDGDQLSNGAEQDNEGFESDPGVLDSDDDGVFHDPNDQPLLDNQEVAYLGTAPSDSVSPFIVRALEFGATGGVGRVVVPDRIKGVATERLSLETWTVELMVRPTSVPAVGVRVPLVTRYVDCDARVNYELGLQGAGGGAVPYVRFSLDGGTGAVQLVTGNRIATNDWTHLAGRFDKSTGLLTVFVDGQAAGALNTGARPARGPGDLVIGSGGFTGLLKEVRVWSLARRDADILAFRNRSLFFDSSATDPGILRGIGDGGHLRQISSTIDPGTGLFTDALDFWTLECWVKTADSDGLIMARQNASAPNEPADFNYRLYLQNGVLAGNFGADYLLACEDDDGNITLEIVIDLEINTLVGAKPVNDGAWHHVAFVRDDRSIYLYVDGELDAKQDAVLFPVPPANCFWLDYAVRKLDGPNVHGRDLAGDLDEMRVWNRGLTATELNDVLGRNLQGNEISLISYFNFDFQQGVNADERAVVRDSTTEFGRFIQGATHVRTTDTPPIDVDPLLVYKETALAGYYSADDGGATVEDFVYKQDFRYAGKFAGDVRFVNVTTNNMPYTGDSDNDALPDWWETIHGLNPGSALGGDGSWGDPDQDGMHNEGEYLVWASNSIPLDPYDPDTLNLGMFDFFGWNTNSTHDFRIFGETFTDFDGMEDSWEFQQGLNPRQYDSHTDSDSDGWKNHSEFMELSNPHDPLSYPTPSVVVTVGYHGFRNQGPIYVSAYSTPAMDGVPDAVGVLGQAQAVTRTPILVSEGGSQFEGELAFIPVVPGSVRIFIGQLTYQDLGNGVLRTVNATPVRFGQIDYASGAWNISTFPSVFPVGTQIFGEWSHFVGVQAFPFSGAAAIIEGHLHEGNNWFFAFIDTDGSGVWNEGEPAGFTRDMPVNINRGTVSPVHIDLRESQPNYSQPGYELPGYGRFSWPERAVANSYRVIIRNKSLAGSPVVIDRLVQAPRTYFHDQDYIYAGMLGLPQGGFEWFVYHTANNVNLLITNNTFVVTYPPTMFAPVPVTPEGAILTYGRNKLKWYASATNGATGFTLQIARNSTFTSVLSTTLFQAPPPDATGNYETYIPHYAGDGAFTNGTYYWRIRGFHPPLVVSPWSVTRSFAVNLADHPAGPYSVSGDILYFGKVTNANFVVQAYRTGSFSLVPESQVTVANSTIAGEWPTNRIPYVLGGLKSGAHYLRAFLDQDGDRLHDAWETHGFIRGQSFYVPEPLSSPPSHTRKQLNIYLADTDNDDIADDWEYQYFASLTRMGPGGLRGYTDSNGDGVLNDFESYAFTPLNVSPLDPDAAGSDRIPFRVKHALGLDPLEPLYFEIGRIERDGQGRSTVSWAATGGGTVAGGSSGRGTQSSGGTTLGYQIQYSPNLHTWWDVLSGGTVTYDAASDTFRFHDATRVDTNGYYRYRVYWSP